MAQKLLLQQQLKDVGLKLDSPPTSKDSLVKLLKQAANYLSELSQSPFPSMLEAMQPSLNALAKPELLKHQDREVEILVATCICEITRITAPEAPYNDETLRDIFRLFVSTFSGLKDINSPSFGRRVVILETLARYRSCVMMLDLDCNDLIDEMFSTFFTVVSDDHPESIITSMQTIMALILEESEDVQDNLLFTIMSNLGRKRNDVSKTARKLAMNIIGICAEKLENGIKQFLLSSISGDTNASSCSLNYREVIYDIYQCAPKILLGIVPYITGELLTDELDVRLEAVKLLGDMFSLKGINISDSFRPLFSEFLKRLTDRVADVRISVIERVKDCMMSNPSRAEASEIISALCDRLLDYDENVRKQVVEAVCDVACHTVDSIPSTTVRLVAERLRDKSVTVKRYTMERLADLYRHYCGRESSNSDDFEWIPGKILRCLYDKDFRPETIEDILCRIFPPDASVKDKLRHWIAIFSSLDKVEVKALEQVLVQKQRLQQDLQKFLSLRQGYKDGDALELQKKISGCIRSMSRLFFDPVKAEESFQSVNQLKDINIWKILTCLLDPCSSFQQAWISRDQLLKILGKKHPLYDFMGILTMRCSYLLFNREFVKQMLSEAATPESVGNAELLPCMNLLAVLACFCPMLLSGSEDGLVSLLKEDNEILKEGVAHILAKAGGVIREQLATTSSSVDLLLERLCLEGNRKQAKYSVQALTAITKDDGLKSLSVLYKRLVDMLEEKTHLPAILQSLGCIAQNAMPVFETREAEIIDFITSRILKCNNDGNSEQISGWNDRSELCLLKVYGIKTLVKSYMPLKDAHLRKGIEFFLKNIKSILIFGELSKDIQSSPVDKAHLRLAAAKAVLRLLKNWDHRIPADIFYLTLRASQDSFPEVRKQFKSKVHQYIKERSIDAKYACAFLYNITESHSPEIKEDNHSFVEVVQFQYQLKARQISMQCDMNPLLAYPEYILVYLIHALAHHPSFPNIDNCKDARAFEPIYWRLHLFLSSLFHGGEGLQTGADANGNRESFLLVVSILHSVKCADDVVDSAKRKNSRALCDLGLSITKHLVRENGDLNELATSVPLPEILYKQLEKDARDSSSAKDEESWLGSASVLAHFESLTAENKDDSSIGKDENVSRDDDIDENEMPLKKIMKTLKLQGAKKKSMLKKQNFCTEARVSENDIDVLGMVREINSRNEDIEQNMETDKVGKEEAYCASGDKKSSIKINKAKNIYPISLSSPKGKRSAFLSKSQSRSREEKSRSLSLQSFKENYDSADVKHEGTIDKDKIILTDSELLVSCLPEIQKKSGSWKKGFYGRSNGSSHGEATNFLKSSTMPTNIKKNGNSTSAIGSSRKRKLKSMTGLAKCSQIALKDDKELVGCRVKVWWPLDKKFYEGKVQSYDAVKRKHAILYDDGDVEVLQLDKESWEIISDEGTPRKKKKSQPTNASEEMYSEEEDQSRVLVSRKNRNSSNKALSFKKRKKSTTEEEHAISEDKNDGSSSDVHGGDNSSASIHSDSKVDDAHSVDSKGKHVKTPGARDQTNEVPAASEERSSEEHNYSSKENSDDEPLSSWKQRPRKK